MFRLLVTLAAVVAVPIGLLCLYVAVTVAFSTNAVFGVVVLLVVVAVLYGLGQLVAGVWKGSSK